VDDGATSIIELSCLETPLGMCDIHQLAVLQQGYCILYYKGLNRRRGADVQYAP
jgi:hypothetical protein